ncbi:MAG TPA: triphosphoribosyl-dephospho-CoA synthase [Chondromyces sp.]|nr:triphosphoribosyl-dephospho-CoA synthase [Chondromyces sp.]
MEKQIIDYSTYLSKLAVQSLIEQIELTPKPGLVDQQNSGAHSDLSFELMIKSARALKDTFTKMAYVSFDLEPSQFLREEIAAIGRIGESIMYQTTEGVNTHKGAIWTLGLLVSAAAMKKETNIEKVAATAGRLARYPDRYCPLIPTNGLRVIERFAVQGAKGEAEQGFPHIVKFAMPALRDSRQAGIAENLARLNALITLIANLDDTCILHRGGVKALALTKKYASDILSRGGVSTPEGWHLLQQLDEVFIRLNISPGGSADLLAGTLFLDSLNRGQLGGDDGPDFVKPYELV